MAIEESITCPHCKKSFVPQSARIIKIVDETEGGQVLGRLMTLHFKQGSRELVHQVRVPPDAEPEQLRERAQAEFDAWLKQPDPAIAVHPLTGVSL